MEKYNFSYDNCRLCARECGADRGSGAVGFCGMGAEVFVARAGLHMWEEPIISGSRGSGAIFFSGCSLRCVYCQNREISRGEAGRAISVDRLAQIMLELKALGAHNINLVTPTHYAPSIREAVAIARSGGLDLPIVYNTASFDSIGTVRALDGTVDVYLPDMKYYLARTAREYSSAASYPEVSLAAIREMVCQKPECIIEDGIIKSGVVVRLLLLPSHVAEAKLNLKRLYSEFGEHIYYSLMSQYTPPSDMRGALARRVTVSEYEELVGYAASLGIKNAFTQDYSSASEEYIPPFDLTGV